tara:strand:+ start:357 stop:1016 length:660 start_codon:yes stop_codon:yes gene_type:complete
MYYIEGNIGAGKSTFITLFEKYLENDEDANLLLEPVESWLNTKDSKGKHILQHYYEDQQKYGFTFQMNAFISRVYEIEEMKKLNKKYNFVERSVYTDRNVFTQLNVENGNIDEIQQKVYEQWFSVFSEKFNLRPQGYIYLKTTPEICEERIKKRDRSGESSIPLEYLTKLDHFHTDWLQRENENGVPVLEIDVTEDYTSNETRQREIFQSIMDFVKIKS